MNLKRVEELLRQYAKARPVERLFSEDAATTLRKRLAPPAAESEAAPGRNAGAAKSLLGSPTEARRAAPRRLAGIFMAAAAALVLSVVLDAPDGITQSPIKMVVDQACDKAALFRVSRGGTPPLVTRDDVFYVGVKVDRPAFVRILVVDDAGEIIPLALQRNGALEQRLVPGKETAFGGYKVESKDDEGVVRRAVLLIVFACPDGATDEVILSWIDDQNVSESLFSDKPCAEFTAELETRFRCTAGLLRLQRP